MNLYCRTPMQNFTDGERLAIAYSVLFVTRAKIWALISKLTKRQNLAYTAHFQLVSHLTVSRTENIVKIQNACMVNRNYWYRKLSSLYICCTHFSKYFSNKLEIGHIGGILCIHDLRILQFIRILLHLRSSRNLQYSLVVSQNVIDLDIYLFT